MTETRPVKLLYVDALNQINAFSGYEEFSTGLLRLQTDVRKFVDAAKAADIELKVFLDGTNRTGEGLEKFP